MKPPPPATRAVSPPLTMSTPPPSTEMHSLHQVHLTAITAAIADIGQQRFESDRPRLLRRRFVRHSGEPHSTSPRAHDEEARRTNHTNTEVGLDRPRFFRNDLG